MQARHEYKHSLNYGDYIILRDRLRRIMSRDANADENGEYRVRSLYFDTPGDKALREKIDGVDRREKFRIRRYIGGGEYLKLEKKSKIHGMCYKRSALCTAEEIAAIQAGDLTWMAADDRELIMDILKYGPEVEVVAPEELRSEIARRLNSAAARYRSAEDPATGSLPESPAGE